jgi:hypothetical protein
MYTSSVFGSHRQVLVPGGSYPYHYSFCAGLRFLLLRYLSTIRNTKGLGISNVCHTSTGTVLVQVPVRYLVPGTDLDLDSRIHD